MQSINQTSVGQFGFSPPIVAASSNPRIGQSTIDAFEVADEEYIEWLIDPSEIEQRFRYVREGIAWVHHRDRPIGQLDNGELGYGVLHRRAPSICPGRRVWYRRVIWWRPDSDPFPIGEAPVEAVDVMTIKPRVPGVVTSRVLFGEGQG